MFAEVSTKKSSKRKHHSLENSTANSLTKLDVKSKKIKKIKKDKEQKKEKLLKIHNIVSKSEKDSLKAKRTAVVKEKVSKMKEAPPSEQREVTKTKRKNRKRKKKHLPRHGECKSMRNGDNQSIDSGFRDSAKSEEVNTTKGFKKNSTTPKNISPIANGKQLSNKGVDIIPATYAPKAISLNQKECFARAKSALQELSTQQVESTKMSGHTNGEHSKDSIHMNIDNIHEAFPIVQEVN